MSERRKREPAKRVEPFSCGGALFEHGMLRTVLLPFTFGNVRSFVDTLFVGDLDIVLNRCVDTFERYGMARPDLREVAAAMQRAGLTPPPEKAGHLVFSRAAPDLYVDVMIRNGWPTEAEVNRAHPACVALEIVIRIAALERDREKVDDVDRLIRNAIGIGHAWGSARGRPRMARPGNGRARVGRGGS